jgi:HPr kinase/phosphorylase
LGGVGLTIEHPEHDEVVRSRELWQSLFAVSDEPPAGAAPSSLLRLQSRDSARLTIREENLISHTDGLRVWKTEHGFRLTLASSVLDIDLTCGNARGALDDSLWQLTPDRQRRFLLLALVMLAHAHERYALHANGAALNGRGCLIAGPSGSGKTTLGLTLLRHGWSYLSDDVVLLNRTGSEVVAHGVTKALSCAPATAARLVGRRAHSGRHKSLFLPQELQVTRRLDQCHPRRVLLPTIVDKSASELIPMEPAEAMMALIQSSAGIMVDRTRALGQLALIKQLVAQAKCFRFLAGRDVLHESERVAGLLAEVPAG